MLPEWNNKINSAEVMFPHQALEHALVLLPVCGEISPYVTNVHQELSILKIVARRERNLVLAVQMEFGVHGEYVTNVLPM